jgi:hypothetical protein
MATTTIISSSGLSVGHAHLCDLLPQELRGRLGLTHGKVCTTCRSLLFLGAPTFGRGVGCLDVHGFSWLRPRRCLLVPCLVSRPLRELNVEVLVGVPLG